MTEPINNLEAVAKYVAETFDGDTFHYTELLDRSKRSGSNKGRLVRTFYHRDRAELYRQFGQIKQLCDATGARALTRLAPRSFQAVGKKFAMRVVEECLTGNWQGMRHER